MSTKEIIFTGTQAWSVETIEGRRYYTTGKGRRAVTATHSNDKWTVMAGASTFSVYRTIEDAAASRKALQTLPSVVALAAAA